MLNYEKSINKKKDSSLLSQISVGALSDAPADSLRITNTCDNEGRWITDKYSATYNNHYSASVISETEIFELLFLIIQKRFSIFISCT
jgi:hypothetical protein